MGKYTLHSFFVRHHAGQNLFFNDDPKYSVVVSGVEVSQVGGRHKERRCYSSVTFSKILTFCLPRAVNIL